MNSERVERLIELILKTSAPPKEQTKRIEMILKQHQLWSERRSQ